MADTQTLNYSWTKPEAGASTGTWGPKVDTVLDQIDAQVKTVANAAAAAQATASAALTTAGGVMTGRVDLLTSQSKRTDLGNIATSQALDLALSNAFTATVTAPVTLSFTNVPSGTFVQGILLKLLCSGSNAVTWPGSVKWAGGSVPVPTYGGTDLFALVSFDAGTTWLGTVRQAFA